jgi:hypothetical protein
MRALWSTLSFALIAASWAVAPSRLAAEPNPRPRSPLEGVAALEKPISLAETKIPLGELVQKIATETGVSLTATPAVADEPVALAVKAMPARRLLEEIADLLDYLWLRRTGKGVSTSAGPPVSGAGTAPTFEITQDLAAKQREEKLRQAVYAAIEKQFREQVQQYARLAELSPKQLAEITAAYEQRQRELEKLSPEERE